MDATGSFHSAAGAVPGPVPGQAPLGRAELGRFAAAVGLFGLLVLTIWAWHIEGDAFAHVAVVALIGFPIHHCLPLRFRLPFFVGLSAVALVVVVGPINALWVASIGLCLFGVCHLPTAFFVRVAILLACGAALIACRILYKQTPGLAVVWPVLGSMFMFRLIVYMYDMRNKAAPFGLWRGLAYFFMLPNVCFPLFPVVDYKSFCRTYYNDDPYRIYEAGRRWMFRGIVQLILYRLVYHYLTVDLTQITGAGGVFQFTVATYMLYLKVSGMFHIIVGLLHLFGFNLAETHHLYLLSSSFTDFWRRINIYWKEFVEKLFFYPVYFRLRKLSPTPRMILATVVAFLATWLLHSYQLFWISGSFPLTGQDILFWSVLGGLVIVNVWFESRFGRQRSITKQRRALWPTMARAATTVGTFLVICTVWSVWTSESFEEWFGLVAKAKHVSLADVAGIGLTLAAIGVGSIVLGHSRRDWSQGEAKGDASGGAAPRRRLSDWLGSPAAMAAVSAVLVLLSISSVQQRLGSTMAEVFDTLESGTLNRVDALRLQRGYYEELTEVNRFNAELAKILGKRPPVLLKPVKDAFYIETKDFRIHTFAPSKTVVFDGGRYTTNQWGLRDRPYDQQKPAGTYRAALIGQSTSMGWGVGDDEVYEKLLEDRLNRDAQGTSGRKVEILNFSIDRYGPIEKLMTIQERVMRFKPDTLFYVAHLWEERYVVEHVLENLGKGHAPPYDELQALAGGDGRTWNDLTKEALYENMSRMLAWVYDQIVFECRAAGVEPVWVLVPPVGRLPASVSVEPLFDMARRAGFRVLDLTSTFDGVDPQTLHRNSFDEHPNARGHEMIADAFHKALRAEATLRVWGAREGTAP